MRTSYLIVLSFGLFSAATFNANAQLIPDATLGGESSFILPNQEVDGQTSEVITGGAVRGENIFHSFQDFNVAEGQSVYFLDPGVARIFSRVTGNTSSEILGDLGVLGASDLILINSSGIAFGPNAQLQLAGGSFIGTTASTVQFSDGTIFSSDELGSPLLSSSIPVGLGFSSPGQISVENTGHTLINSPSSVILETAPKPGLAVVPGQELILIGGEINFNGGIIRAPDGLIEAAAVEEGLVEIIQPDVFEFAYDGVTLGDVRFDRRSFLTASGLIGGSVSVQGNRIALLDGSFLSIESIDSSIGLPGNLQVNANELFIDGQITSLDLSGVAPNEVPIENVVPAGLSSVNFGAGNGPDISVTAEVIDIKDGGRIQSRSYSTGLSGDVSIEADQLNITGFNPFDERFFSNILSVTLGDSEAGGDINVSADVIKLIDGGGISSSSFSDSTGGNVFVEADEIVISRGTPRGTFPSSITSGSFRSGDSGSVEVNTGMLRVLSGGRVGTLAQGSGNAGETTIVATQLIEVDGRFPDVPENPVLSPEEIIALTTQALEAGSSPPEVLRVSNLSIIGSDSNVVSTPGAQDLLSIPIAPTGSAGSVVIQTPRLNLSNGGLITATNSSVGDAGSLSIVAEEIRAESRGGILAFSNGGEGGNIFIDTSSLFLANQAGVASAAVGDGNGGNIVIGSNIIGLVENSRINANAQTGSGGQVEIATTGLFQDPFSTITATSAAGPQLDGAVLIQSPEVDLSRASILESPAVQPPQTSSICAGRQDAGRSEFVVTGTGGVPISPDAPQRSYSGWSDAESSSTSDAPLSEVTPSTIVEAQGFAFNPDGTFSLALVADDAVFQAESGHRQNCLSNVPGDS